MTNALFEIREHAGRNQVTRANTVKPVYNDRLYLLELILVAFGHLDELQKAEVVSKSKLIPSVVIKTHYWINYR